MDFDLTVYIPFIRIAILFLLSSIGYFFWLKPWFLKRKSLLETVKFIGLKPKWWWLIYKIRKEARKQLKPTPAITWTDIKKIILNIPGVKDIALQTDPAKIYIKTAYWTSFEKIFNSVKNELKEKTPFDFYIRVKIAPWNERINPKLDYK